MTAVAVTAAVVLSTVALVTLHNTIEETRNQYDTARAQAMYLVLENEDLTERIKALGSVESAVQIAMEELGLVHPDALVINPGN